MSPASSRSFAIIIGATIILIIYTHAGLSFTPGLSFSPISFGLGTSLDQRRGADEVLPVPSRTYVISLPHRVDRYEDMERLRTRLGVRWTYVVAEDSRSPLVARIMSQVRSLRQEELKMKEYAPNSSFKLPFEWPTPDVAVSRASFPESLPEAPPSSGPADEPDPELPLTCATENLTLVPYSSRLPEYKILSLSRIACWHSHLSVIQRVSTHRPNEVALILEDDVDMEEDITERLTAIWSLLPSDWDIIFLGHCWSNESYHPPLGLSSSSDLSSSVSTRLHPSYAPLCTHAYALSPTGAQRLLLDLTYPRFAYSRAIDHALAWVVQSGRLNAFSVVPSVIVQRKIGNSDVGMGKGSGWRDRLVKGVHVDGGSS
ncbi:hypothetical protein DFH08DRAFT_1025500 [Mycena albidolilacea]|uniref:Glycosyl transferase family 25 domain-containing protein n=1 Tax=Mycena albidolilacea TaxID=1033008 RepID=A0AAD7ANT8_9AGAR|nr:hypothetical protein DFH08DRAFT_1025500 [Mycena albidolilacea]